MGVTFRWFNLLDSALFLLLACAGLGRSIKKYHYDGRRFPIPRASRSVHGVFLLLFVYAIVRSGVLFCIGIGQIPNNEGFAQAAFNTLPAVFLCMLQTALVAKWVGHVEDLTLLLYRGRFRFGAVAVSSSAALLVCYLAVTCVALWDAKFAKIGLSRDDWSTFCNFMSGVLYTFNGVCFIGLGLRLRALWDSPSDADREARWRILGIALVFGTMCVVRGLILCMFILQSQESVSSVVDSGWGAPTVLLFEWLCIVCSLFLLATQSSAAANAAAATAASPTACAASASGDAVILRPSSAVATYGTHPHARSSGSDAGTPLGYSLSTSTMPARLGGGGGGFRGGGSAHSFSSPPSPRRMSSRLIQESGDPD